jgi:rRNA-processing protein FCF1
LKQVIFDSSFLMAVVDTPTTWFEDIVDDIGRFEPVILDCVRRELEKMAAGQAKRSRSARVCLELASAFTAVSCGKASVDDELVSAALTLGALVATTDSKLAGSARAAHLRVVSLRSGRVNVD